MKNSLWKKCIILGIIMLLMWASLVLILVPQVEAAGNDSLSQSYFWQGYGGYIANGIGMWLQGGPSASGDIIISDIPDGAIIEAAFLYWCTWEEINPPCTSITVNGIPVIEDLIGTKTEIDLLWPEGTWPHTYRGYRADISSIVTENGIFEVSGFPTGTEYDHQNTMGATIVVIYSHPMAPLVSIIINDGMVALHARPQSYTTTLSDFVVSSSPAAQITYIAGQAEPQWTLDWQYFNEELLAQNGLDGSDGPLWDTDTYDVSSYISEGDTSAKVTVTMQDDWIAWVATIFQVKENGWLFKAPFAFQHIWSDNTPLAPSPYAAAAKGLSGVVETESDINTGSLGYTCFTWGGYKGFFNSFVKEEKNHPNQICKIETGLGVEFVSPFTGNAKIIAFLSLQGKGVGQAGTGALDLLAKFLPWSIPFLGPSKTLFPTVAMAKNQVFLQLNEIRSYSNLEGVGVASEILFPSHMEVNYAGKKVTITTTVFVKEGESIAILAGLTSELKSWGNAAIVMNLMNSKLDYILVIKE